MFFNRSKTNVNLTININGSPLEQVNEFCYLGLLIDKELKFKNHILNISSKINSANYLLSSLKFILPEFVLIKLYYSLVHSHLNNHILAWGGSNQTSLHPLLVSVNKSIRIICHHPLDTSTKFSHHNILKVPQIYELKLGEIMFKTIVLDKPPLLVNVLPEITFSHEHMTRDDRLRLPRIHTELNRRFFLSNAVRNWNALPKSIKYDSSSVYVFKKAMKGHILSF